MKNYFFGSALVLSMLMGASSIDAFAQDCSARCMKFCQARGAQGSGMGACQSKCNSNCEIEKSNKGAAKPKK
jgi:hypothetical protein